MIFKGLRHQPLLSPPLQEDSPYLEIGSGEIQRMRNTLKRIREGKPNNARTLSLASMAASMKSVGVDVNIDNCSDELVAELFSRCNERRFEQLVGYAASLTALGFADVDKVVDEFGGWMEGEYFKRVRSGDYSSLTYSRILDAAGLKEIGRDITIMNVQGPNVDRYMDNAAAAGHWNDYAKALAALKQLGADVTDKVTKHEEDIKKTLHRMRADGYWLSFASYAADLKELGLLTLRQRDDGGMPPLKRFGR